MSRQSAIRLMRDIEDFSADELDSIYGITIDPDGGVWDCVEGREFSSLFLWAEFTASQEETNDSFHRTGSNGWHDDD